MGRRRLLAGLAVVVAALLVVGLDGWIVHHFGHNAATKQYPDDYLNAVACPSTAQCWAVGQTASAPGGNTLSEDREPLLKHEQDGRWRTEPVAASGAKGSTFQDIACPGATDCWAVGGDAAGGYAIIAHWDGAAWRLVPSPVLAVAKPHVGNGSRVSKANSVGGGQLDSVSCASPAACWATGGTQAHSGAIADVFEQWNGIQWTMASTVAGGLQPQQFSCPAAGFCMALGQRDGRPGARGPRPRGRVRQRARERARGGRGQLRPGRGRVHGHVVSLGVHIVDILGRPVTHIPLICERSVVRLSVTPSTK